MMNHGNRIRLMTFTSLFYSLMMRWRFFVALVVLLLAAAIFVRMPDIPTPEMLIFADAARGVSQGLDVTSLLEHAAVFRPLHVQPVVVEAPTWHDFRFAGTFFMYTDADEPEASMRRAIISYQPEQRQYIVSEGDMIAGAEVIRIAATEVTLRRGDEEGVLQLRGERAATATATQGASDIVAADAVMTTRFGEQVRPGSWRMDREALLAYYEELLDEPERLLQVFDSMQPMYMEDGSISGYQLQTVGEAAFFEAVGFQEGDKVRAVNTLAMTNRRRAEFFIRQVVENDLDAIVIDLERNGEPVRLVYELQ